MAVLLMDYENIQSSRGMQGFQYIGTEDKIYLFYSTACPNIRNEYIEHIYQVGCEFIIIKLQKARKNALDFYIACEAGALVAKGETQIAIISGDTGLQSIADFYLDNPSAKVVVQPSIEQGILALDAPEDKDRRRLILNAVRHVSIESEYGKISERQRIRRLIKEIFQGTPLESKVRNIISFYEASQSFPKKQRYTQSLHWFGRVEGLQIYQKLKGCG